jgi:hypothetical protein
MFKRLLCALFLGHDLDMDDFFKTKIIDDYGIEEETFIKVKCRRCKNYIRR